MPETSASMPEPACMTAPPPPDEASRRDHFARRNTPDGLAELSAELAGMIDLDGPGLPDSVAALLRESPGDAALAAYRDYFLGKLRHPDAHGIHTECLPLREPAGVPFDEPAEAGPTAAALMQNIFTVADRVSRGLRRVALDVLRIDVGDPGAIDWALVPAPWSVHVEDAADSEARPFHVPDTPHFPDTTLWHRRPAIFGRYFRPRLVFEFFDPLLAEYARTRDRAYLDKWSAFIDDWCMNQKADADRSPHNLLLYHPNEAEIFCFFLERIRYLLETVPGFGDDLSAATLARTLVRLVRESPAATIRQMRPFPSNWRYLQAQKLVVLGLVLREFDISDRLILEGRRMLEITATQPMLPDGTDYEDRPGYNWYFFVWGTGPMTRFLQPRPPAWMTPAWQREMHDYALVRARFLLHNVLPQGCEFPSTSSDRRSQHDQFVGPMGDNVAGVLEEPDSARIIDYVYGNGERSPSFTSESYPYVGHHIIREGWDRQSQVGFLKCSPITELGGSGSIGQRNNAFSLYGFDAELTFVHHETPLTVDGMGQNPASHIPHGGHGGLRPDIGPEHEPARTRWHTSAHFDLAEGIYDGPYSSAPQRFIGSIEDDEKAAANPVTDVSHCRQVLFVRELGLWIITDRLESEQERDCSQLWMFHVPEKDPYGPIHGFAPEEIDIDPQVRSIRTSSTGGPDVSLYHFGPELSYEAELAPPNPEGIDTWTTAGRDPAFVEPGPYVEAFTVSRVRANWRGSGDEVLVTVIYPRRRPEDEIGDIAALADVPGVCGFDLTMPSGHRVRYGAATTAPAEPSRRARVELAGIAATAEALLVVSDADGESRGIVLGCESMAVDGHPHPPESEDFEFEAPSGRLAFGRVASTVPIYRPIHPVIIEPGVNVFTDQEDVSIASATPGVKIHYTLDGDDPTPDSPLYSGPVTLSETATVKAVAFRDGVTVPPPVMSGTHATAVSRAVFTRQQARLADDPGDVIPGLVYDYYEGDWQQLFLFLHQLEPNATGTVQELLDISERRTEGPFAFGYNGWFEAPERGVYTFHAPLCHTAIHLETGCDMQLALGGEWWYPSTRRHGFGTWSIALEKGLHPLSVTYADFRGAKMDLYHPFAEYGCAWHGERLDLLISGPGLAPQPVPSRLLWRTP